jgi:hypothetical protein
VLIVWGLVEIYGQMIAPDQPTASAMSGVNALLRGFGTPLRG